MYEKNGKRISESQALYAANQKGYSLEEWASSNGWTIVEGKQNDLTETDPPANQNTETSAGESSSGDISLGSPDYNPYLLTIEDLEGEEEDVEPRIKDKMQALGIRTDQAGWGNSIMLQSKNTDGQGHRIRSTANLKDKKKALDQLNAFILEQGDLNHVDGIKAENQDVIKGYYEATAQKEMGISEANDIYIESKIKSWNKAETISTPRMDGSSMFVADQKRTLEAKDFETPEELDEYLNWKETGVVNTTEDQIKAYREELIFNNKIRSGQKYIDNLPGDVKESVAAVLSKEKVDLAYRANNIESEIGQIQMAENELAYRIDEFKNNPTNKEDLLDLQNEILSLQNQRNDVATFIESISDTDDLMIAVDNFNKDYSLLNKLGVDFKRTAVDLGYAGAQLLTILGIGLVKSVELGTDDINFSDEMDKVDAAWMPLIERGRKEGQLFATAPTLNQVEDMDDLFDWVGGTAVAAIPSLSMAFTGPAAMPLFFLSGYGSTSAEATTNQYEATRRLATNAKLLEENRVNMSPEEIMEIESLMADDAKVANISQFQKMEASVIAGAAEVLFERLGTINIVRNAAKAINPTSLRGAGVKFIKAANLEGMTEGATQISNNWGKRVFFDEQVNLFEGLGEAYAGGALIGGPLSLRNVAPAVYEYAVSTLMDKSTRAEVQAKLNQLEELTGIGNLQNVLDPNTDLEGLSPEVKKLATEVIGEIELLKSGIANRLGDDLSNEVVIEVGQISLEMQQINQRFTKIALSGVAGAELAAAEKTLRAKFDKLAEKREALLSYETNTKEAKAYNASLKVSMDAADGYKSMLYIQNARKQSESFREFNKLKNSAQSDYITKAKEALGENATSEEIRFKAGQSFHIEKNKNLISENKIAAEKLLKESGLEVDLIEANEAEFIKKGGSINGDAFISADGKTIVVNTETAARNGRTGVWAHEALHAIVQDKLGSDKNANAAGEELLGWLQKNAPETHAYVKARLDVAYTEDGVKNKAYYEETMNVLSDYIAEGNEIGLKSLSQINVFINGLVRGNKTSIEIQDGEQTFAFIANYANKNKSKKTAKLIRNFARAFGDEDRKNAKSSQSISKEAERAKQVLAKVSSDMELFEPNSPLIAKVIDGMVQAQLAKLSIKGLKFDAEEAKYDIIARIYYNQDINKFDGRGTLYGYINGRISFRIKDMLKASGEGKNDIVEDFNQSDIEDLKGAAADVTTIEQVEERVEAERPEYRPLLNSRIAKPELVESILAKIPRIVGTLKNRIDAPVSKNTTVTPLVNELRLALGKQIDIDLKKAMGGKKDGVLRRFLVDSKKAILENMTTTYLMSAFPAAVQKKVDGVWTSDWKGKKIDRETTNTDKAGRTSGAELVRRLPNASMKIDDKTFLSFILDEKGNPLRGKKESLAKAIAEELAIEIINQEMQNPDSQIRQAFEANQERLGTEIVDNYVAKLKLDLERGNVKYSSSGWTMSELQDPQNLKAFDIVVLTILRSDKIFPDDYSQDNKSFSPSIVKQFKANTKELGVDIDNVDFDHVFWHTEQLLNSPAAKYKLLPEARFNSLIKEGSKELQEGLEGFTTVRVLEGKGELKDLKAYKESIGLIESRISGRELKVFNSEGFKDSIQPEVISIVAGSVLTKDVLNNVTKYTTQETSAKALFELQKRGDLNNTLQSTDTIGLLQAQNLANRKLSSRIAGEFILAVKTGEISLIDFARFLQKDNANRGGGFGPLGQLTIIDGNVDIDSDLYIEHMYPNVQFMLDLLEIAANPSLSTFSGALSIETIEAIDKAYDKNILMSTSQSTAKPVIDKILKPTNPTNIERLRLYGEAARDNTYFAAVNEEGNLITLTEYFESLTKAEAITEQLSINYEAVNSFQGWLQSSVKNSMSTPIAVFMVGGPGSGKSSTLKSLGLINKGFRLVNQDPYLEKYIKDAGLASDEKTYNKEERSLRAKLGWKARKAAEEDLANNTAARESMVVDGTGASYKATTKKMKALEAAGFEVHMVHVNTSKDVAVQRNRARAERSLADFIVTKTWDSVQESAKQYKEDYAGRFYEVNTDNLSYGEALPEAFVNQVTTGLEASGVKFSQGLSKELNDMIERTKGVAADKVYSKAQARMMGEGKGKYRVFVPASAEDLRGLTSYTFAAKGKQGEADQKFIEDNIITPYTRGVAMIEAVKQQIRREVMALRKADEKLFKMLGKKITNSDYTYDQALRVYMWTQQGIDIPGMNKDDIRFLINAINAMPQLIEMGNAMQRISRQDTWMEPGEHWLSRTLVSDLNGMTEKVGRKKYLQEFIENSEAIFSPENLNKIEAVYGTRHKEALKDALFAMTNGTNRVAGSDNAQVNAWYNWVNNSTGAIMFFNRRSAILQTLSTANFINWSDNNPLKVALAFANQPQYWSDFAMIFNSDKLKERRSGLQTDVNQAEIANEAKGAKNKAGAVIAYLLKIGFTPTQIADSFAIAAGGASFYRNRVNTYLKEGMKQKAAEKQAFEDFSKTADEAQQSSDPYLVSQEQRSPLGRLVLAFQNTPMQYTRLMKKSMQDLANGRGDAKTHISKIIYYGAVQNFIFSALQSALFSIIPGFDEEDESEMTEKELEKLERKNDQRTLRIINSMTDSILKGSGVRGAALATIKNTITEYFKQEEKGFTADHTYTILQALSLSPPIGSKARKLYSAIQTKKFERDTLAARGFDVTADGKLNLSPSYSIIGSLASAIGNVPLDRVVDELNSIVESLDSRNTAWQRIALALGWKTWDVGALNEEHDLIKTEAKAKRKEEGKAKAKKTREENKKKKEAEFKALTPAEKYLERKRKAEAKRNK
jgi:hypothetical protein